MLIDALAELTTAVGFDLEAVRPGPGKPIKMYGSGLGANAAVAITHGTTAALAEGGLTACIDVVADADGEIEFHLPSTTQQFIACTFAQGWLGVVMDGQTNK
jgi:hypothetical protein